MERLKDTQTKARGSAERQHEWKQSDKGRLTRQKGEHVHSIRLTLSFQAAARLHCADYESIIWDWQSSSYSTACQTHSHQPIFLSPSSLFLSPRAHTMAIWWRLNDWKRNEVETWKNNRKKKKKYLERLVRGECKEGRERISGEEVWRTRAQCSCN